MHQVLLTEFHCASCQDLIKLNPSLVGHESLEEALDPLYLPVQEVLEVPAASIPPPRTLPGASHLPESQTDSFVLLSRPPHVALPHSTLERNSLSHRLKIANKLFEFASGLSLVQHPLCQDCADELTIKLEKRLGAVKKERDAYATYLESLQNQPAAPETKISLAEIEKDKLEEQERVSLATLAELDQESALLANELKDLEKELEEIEELEKSHWCEINDFENQSYEFQEELQSVQLKTADAKRHLDKLKKTNVYNDAFRIWHDGSFGTINGLRFGRLPQQPVEWSEINAAAGQALFLLDTLAKKLNFTFKMWDRVF